MTGRIIAAGPSVRRGATGQRGRYPFDPGYFSILRTFNNLAIFFSIVLPLVRPMIGAFVMITFLATWNNFIHPQVVLQSPEKFPLAVAIANLRDVYAQNLSMLTAATVTSVAPVVVLFLFLQKEYLSGLTAGALRG